MGIYAIDWDDIEVSERLDDGDVVSLTMQDIEPNVLEICLELAPHIAWWKGVEVYDNSNRLISSIECQANLKEAGPIRIDLRDIRKGSKIWLCKAKEAGVHSPKYQLAYLEHKKGKRLTFRWSAD
jgi:hypothetical protein